MEQAQKQSASYDNNIVAGIEQQDIKNQSTIAATLNKDKNLCKIKETKKQCYFCGNTRHQRINCPACEAECRKCKKKGHWAKVCVNHRFQQGLQIQILHSRTLHD